MAKACVGLARGDGPGDKDSCSAFLHDLHERARRSSDAMFRGLRDKYPPGRLQCGLRRAGLGKLVDAPQIDFEKLMHLGARAFANLEEMEAKRKK